MTGMVMGRAALSASGPLVRELLTVEADAWQRDVPPEEPSQWMLGELDLSTNGPPGAQQQAAAWAGEPDDIWLRQPRAAKLDESTAALVYEAEATIDGAIRHFVASTVYNRDGRHWRPVMRHVSAASRSG